MGGAKLGIIARWVSVLGETPLIWLCMAGVVLYWVFSFSGPKEVFDPEANTRRMTAELIRQQADCKAEQVEFPNLVELHQICAKQTAALVMQIELYTTRLREKQEKDAAKQ